MKTRRLVSAFVALLSGLPLVRAQGVVRTPIGAGDDESFAAALQADGKIVVAGFARIGSFDEVAVVRYNADLSLDTSFDGDGVVRTNVGVGHDRANAVAIQLDGKIVVTGFAGNGSNNDVFVARYNPNGSLDTSFSGDGIQTTDISGGDDQGRDVAIQSDGKIVVGGYTNGGGNYDFIAVRYTAAGALDVTFDTDGIARTDLSAGANDKGEAVAIQTDGKILVAGNAREFAAANFGVVRYNPNGSLDTTFDTDGIVTTDVSIGREDDATALLVQPDGRIVASGTSDNGTNFDFSAARYNTNGSLDLSFDGDGKVMVDVGGNHDLSFSIALQPDGKLIQAGWSLSGNWNFALVRYNANGSLDPTFDTDGKVTTDIGGGARNDHGYGVVVEANGNVVLAGSSSNGTDLDVVVARYCPAGSLVAQYSGSFSYRKAITISSDEVGGSADLVDFPVLIHVTDPALRTTGFGGRVQRADGADIVFRAGCNLESLDHEVEKYVASTGELVAWVRVPLLRHKMDTVLFLYYGNGIVACATENPNGVWASSYRGVWHLDEDPSGPAPQFEDSTGYRNRGAANTMTAANQAPGKIDQSLSFDDSNERHALMPHQPSLQLPAAMTVSAWIQTIDVDADDAVIAMKWADDPLKRNYWLGKFSGANLAFYVDDTQNVMTLWNTVNNGTFHHVVGVADPAAAPGGGLRIYVDGLLRNEAPYSGSSRTETGDFRIGNSTFPFQTFDGLVDEVHVAAAARSAGWIQTSFRNQSSPGSFYSVGAEQAAPFNAPWIYGYRKKLTVDSSRVTCGSNVTDFPVLVSLVDPDLRTVADGGRVAHPNGYDIIFRDSTGLVTLDSEIEAYQSSGVSGTLVAWVRVPTLAAAADTDIYMYYGNAAVSCPDQTQDPAGVWDANFRAVWHLKEDLTGAAPPVRDSTSNSNHGSPAGGMTSANQLPGIIAGSLSFDGIDDLVNAGSLSSVDDLGPLTVSAWVRPDVFAGNAGKIVAKYESAATPGRWYLELDDSTPEDDTYEFSKDFSTTPLQRITSNGTATYTDWQHVVATWDGFASASNVHIYRNGVELTYQANVDGVGSKPSDDVHPLILGNTLDGTQGFDGLLDEIRLSNVLRSQCWIETEYNNQSLPTKDALCSNIGFVCVGPEEVGPPTAVGLVSFTASPRDARVLLEWETGSEVDNLGFHLYRSTSGSPYRRLTETLIPGLGSSPSGAKYSYTDSGLTNGVVYSYKLEDVERGGRTTQHGPVTATPTEHATQDGGEPRIRIAYGDPERNEVRIRRDGRGVEIELATDGFYAFPEDDGSVRVEIPHFAPIDDGSGIDLPVYRSLLEAVAGQRVSLASIHADDVRSFATLAPGASEAVLQASTDGVVRAARRRRERARASANRGADFYPEDWARILSVGFQGDVKKALVELAPLRWDAESGGLVLARRLRVRVSFAGRDPNDALSGPRARRYRESTPLLTRLATREAGLYGVRFETLFGRRRALPASEIRLSRQGEAVPFHVEPSADRFGPGSTLYFLSEGASLNAYGREAVYELELGRGESMTEISAPPSGPELGYALETLAREESRFYQAALVESDELWFWDLVLAPMTKDFPFQVSNPSSAEASAIEVRLQGTTDFPTDADHHVRAYVNGNLVAEEWWDGRDSVTLRAELAPGSLRVGENALAIENVGDTGAVYSMVMVDRFTVRYPAGLEAREGVFRGRFQQSGTASIRALGPGTLVLDVTDDRPRWLSDTRANESGLGFRVERGREYYAVAPSAVLSPEVRRVEQGGLRRDRSGAAYLVIGPRSFLAAVEPLLAFRRSEGLVTRSASTEEVASEFGHGELTPESIKAFLSYAFHERERPALRYVLLLGDATYDFKDYLGTGKTSELPAPIVKTTYLWTASDPWYAAVHGDDVLPDVAMGRLPASSVDELEAMVRKILAYETGEGDPSAPVVLVTDDPDTAGDFVSDAEELASTVLSGESIRRIHLAELGAARARSAIATAFDDGASLMSYLGHGAIHMWASEKLLELSDVDRLTLQTEQPILLTMNCLNGYFHFPYFDSLSERLVKTDGKGAIAAFSPSGLSVNAPAHRFHRELLEELVRGRHPRLGDAILAAQAAYADTGALPELLQIYHLLGDPALGLR